MNLQEINRYVERLYGIVNVQIDLTLSTFSSLEALKEEGLFDEWPQFNIIQEGLEYQLVFQFYRILSSSKDECNLPRFLGFVENNHRHIKWEKKIDPKKPLEHKRSIESHSSFSRLLQRRHKYFAHYDREYFLNPRKLDLDHPFDINDFENLYKFVKTIVDYYMSCYCPGRGIVPSRYLMSQSAGRIAAILAEAKATKARNYMADCIYREVSKSAIKTNHQSPQSELAEAYRIYYTTIFRAEGQKSDAESRYAHAINTLPTDEQTQIDWHEYQKSIRDHEKAAERRRNYMPY